MLDKNKAAPRDATGDSEQGPDVTNTSQQKPEQQTKQNTDE
jgi:hypothetical protein